MFYHAPVELWLIRHGVTANNRAGIYQGGALDPPLSAEGRRQAGAMAAGVVPLLREHAAPVLYTSPMRRARQTVAPLARALAQTPVAVDWLREFRYGHWEGLTLAQIETRFPEQLATWRQHPQHMVFQGGETLADLRARISGGLKGLLKAHDPGDTLVLTAHSGSLRMVLMTCLSMPLGAFRRLRLDNTAVCRLARHDGQWVLLGYNQRFTGRQP